MTDTMWKGYIEVRNLRELPDDEHFPITDFLSTSGAASSRIAIRRSWYEQSAPRNGCLEPVHGPMLVLSPDRHRTPSASRRDRAGAILRPIAGCAL
jgi:hypothetical protein